MRQLLLMAALCLAFFCSTHTCYAQSSEFVTGDNISNFSQYRAGLPGDVVCMAKGGERTLGSMVFSGAPSVIMLGALFRPMSPSIADQEKRLRKQISSAFKGLKRPMSSKARRVSQQRIKKAQKTLALLSSYTTWCNTFVPASRNPGGPSGSYPSDPSSPDGNRQAEAIFVDDSGEGPTHTCAPDSIQGAISGGGATLVTLANDSWIQTKDASSGGFSFEDVPEGVYTLVAESDGASFGPAHTVVVRSDGSCETISFTRHELTGEDVFAFRWRQQEVLSSGLEQHTKVTLSEVDTSTNVSLSVSSEQPSSSSSAAEELSGMYKITLASSDMPWGMEHAERLRTILQKLWPASSESFPITKKSSWVLTEQYLQNDIEIVEEAEHIRVRITAEAFRYAALTPAVLDGVRGLFFSERLLIATARFVTREGRDRSTLEQIFVQRFNTYIADDLGLASALVSSTTGEGTASFQLFTNEELLQILAALSQRPPTSQWMYIIRRRNGVPHPFYKDSVGVIPCPSTNTGTPYIEFTRDAFLPPSSDLIKDRLQTSKEVLLPGVIAATAGIMWDRTISQEMKDAWIREMDWSYDAASKDWNNSNPTELGARLPVGVVEYGPVADFATSVAKYMANPEELRLRSPKRFEFLKLYVMHGVRYVRQLREDLTFPVLNLRPDFSYPGKIKSASVVITGAPTADKFVRTRLVLEGTDPMEHGASWASLTLRNRNDGSLLYLGVYAQQPDPVYGTSLVLEGSTMVSRYAKGGFYDLVFASITDRVDNTRYENGDTIRLKFFLSNTLTPPEPARLIPDSIKLSLSETTVSGVKVPVFNTEFQVTNPDVLTGAYDYLAALNSTRSSPSGSASLRKTGNTIRISRAVSPFIPSDMYGIYSLSLSSVARCEEIRFTLNGDDSYGALPMPLVELENSSSDVQGPEIDLNSIRVSAESMSPDKPNGATKVRVSLRTRDDLSGLSYVSFCLRTPIDRNVCGSFNLGLRTAILPEGSTEWKEYETTLFLPAGSAPGTWGLDSITAADRVGNFTMPTLTEVVKFIVDNNSAQ